MLDVTKQALDKALSNGSQRERVSVQDVQELNEESFANRFCSLWSRAEPFPTIGPWFFSNKECTRFAFLSTNEVVATFVLKQKGE
ncbi:hypothetical protein PBI_UNTOUCHABLE_43 [Gordonia phage Untouchable]|uniref:Uncharacterized protein n=1 Tax=Gordonia phage Untouchable TaxID=2656542 RepID=A0A649V9Q7_9CAUD|nr:hypothetical protein HWC79_gp43 [Gordonia phage Untouchable]QGJ89088.1 hypothetical protein PBI_UNTOUCHABLE_43 [Gordonia phage Untouchable]WAB10428.1 hypothetical protein SEA_PHEPPER_43 [Gordonia phage Phepper]WIC89935.1 hypothetical protein SEA_HYDRUS_44 [Gordonia phage Hydrus]